MSSVMSSSLFAVSLDMPDASMPGPSQGLGISSESQAFNDLTVKTMEQVASGGCDANKAESLMHSLQSLTKARVESKQNNTIEHNATIIKQQMSTIAELSNEINKMRLQKQNLETMPPEPLEDKKRKLPDTDKENQVPKPKARKFPETDKENQDPKPKAKPVPKTHACRSSRQHHMRRGSLLDNTEAFSMIRSCAWVVWLANQVLSKVIEGKAASTRPGRGSLAFDDLREHLVRQPYHPGT